MENKIAIEELNTLLRGTYMGIRSFEHYIQKTNDDNLKKEFQKMQQETKRSAEKIAERIQDLGGVPANDEGVSGSLTSFIHNMMLSDKETDLLEDAVKGMEKYGVEYSEELVRGDLDKKSREVAEEVIDRSRKHAEKLKQLLSQMH